jgi:hypothetical protein
MAGVGIAQHAVDYCIAHADRMGVGRTSAIEREAIRHEGNELQRCLRDVQAVASRTTRLGAIAGPAGATEV